MATKNKQSKTSYKTANPEYAKAIAELRRSSAAGTHGDKRSKRARTRSAQRSRALADW